jgi:hypothetical protein
MLCKYPPIRQCWLIPALAVILSLADKAKGQGIIYEQFPVTGGTTFPYDANGQRLWAPDQDHPQTANIVINGQVAFTFYSGSVFSVEPSSLNAVIALQPNLANNPLDPTAFAVPLTAGQEIGPDAAGNSWVGNVLGVGGILTSARASDEIGQPLLLSGYFTGVEQAYIGLEFQENGQTYYGWASAGAPVVGINGGWVYDYAYETIPNTPIFAGEVPEPSTGLLIVVGGAMALFIQRRMGH